MSQEVDLGDWLYRAVGSFGTAECFTDAVSETRHSGDECLERIDARTEWLRDTLDSLPGWLALLVPNDVRYLAGYVALQRLGVCTAELLPDWPEPLVERAVDDVAAPAALVDTDCVETYRSAFADYEAVDTHESLQLLRRDAPASDAELPDETAALAFTGGTGGGLKAAMLPERGYVHVVREVNRYLDNTSDDVVSTALPWQHGYGKSVMLSALTSGARLCRLPRAMFAQPVWEVVRDEGVTTYSGVPTQYRKWLREGSETPLIRRFEPYASPEAPCLATNGAGSTSSPARTATSSPCTDSPR